MNPFLRVVTSQQRVVALSSEANRRLMPNVTRTLEGDISLLSTVQRSTAGHVGQIKKLVVSGIHKMVSEIADY